MFRSRVKSWQKDSLCPEVLQLVQPASTCGDPRQVHFPALVDGPRSARSYADLARLCAKVRAVAKRPFRFVLPLVDHLVQQRLQGLPEPVPPRMTLRDGD